MNEDTYTVEFDWAEQSSIPPSTADQNVTVTEVALTGYSNGWPTYRITGTTKQTCKYLRDFVFGGDQYAAVDYWCDHSIEVT